MVDTVKLYSREFALERGHRGTRRMVLDSGGGIVREEGWKFPLGSGCMASVMKDRTGKSILYLDGSLPKLLYGTSLRSCVESDYERTVGVLSDRLGKAGVSIPSDAFDTSLHLSRVDFCKNLSVENPLPSYLSAFSRYHAPRQDQAQWNSETLLWMNSRRELTMYDKVADEMAKQEDAKMQDSLRTMRHDVLRIEGRYKRGEVVRNLLHLDRKPVLADVFDVSLSRRLLVGEVGKLVRRKVEEPVGGYADLSQMLAQSNGNVRLLRLRMGSSNLLAQFEFDADRMLAFFMACGVPRRTAYRHRSQILTDCAYFVKQSDAVLVEEVREKLAA